MPAADLSAFIRTLAKQQYKSLMAAAKAGRDRYLAQAAKAKDGPSRQRLKTMAKHAMEEGTAAANRLRISADNAADSYARTMRRLTEETQAAAAKLIETARAKSAAPNKTKKAAKAKAAKA